MSVQAEQVYGFGPYTLDSGERVLLREGRPVPLTPKAFEVLRLLVERHGHIVEKGELLEKVWADSFVEEGNLKVTVSLLRKALEESAAEHPFIETVPRRGYRFVAPVTEACDEAAEPRASERADSEIALSEIASEKKMAAGREEKQETILSARARNVLWPALAACVAVGLALAGYLIWAKHADNSKGAQSGEIKSIAVLPFKSLVANSGDEYLEIGIADTLITRLTSIREIAVRPTSAVRKYGGAEQDPLAAGRELKVESVLEGNIQRLGDRIRVTARLVRVGDGSPLWADQFDEKFTDIFSVEDAISQKVAGALALRLSGEEQARLTKRYTQNSEAYQLYLEGRYFWSRRSRESVEQAVEYFQRAIRIDPNYALAYAGLSDAYSVQLLAVSPGERLEKAKETALKAIELDDSLAEAHTSLASVLQDHDWDFPRAEEEFLKAIRLNPNYATAHQWYAEYLARMGRLEQAMAEMRRAQELDPQAMIIHSEIGLIYYEMRQYDQAVEQLSKTLEMDASLPHALDTLAKVYEQKGMFNEAIDLSERRMGDAPESRQFIASLREAYAISGAKGYWRKWVEQTEQEYANKGATAADLAEIYAAAGERERAFEFLDKAFAYRSTRLLWMKVDPQYDSLRSDPRFANLLARVGLPPV
jgi:DNA-binding winged helix-turn-helix (wHTH) protein/TolB-like protein